MPAKFANSKRQEQSATSRSSSARPDSRPQLRGGAGARANKGGAGGQEAKGQGGEGDPAKGDTTSSHLTEVDREWYNIRIQDLEDKLSRYIILSNFEKIKITMLKITLNRFLLS